MAEKEYIERKAVLDYIDKRKWKMFADPDGKHRLSIEVVEDVIKDFPAANVVEADVAPVRHGRWIIIETLCGGGKGRKHYRCSECNKANVIRSNYCGNCGARMDGDPDD